MTCGATYGTPLQVPGLGSGNLENWVFQTHWGYGGKRMLDTPTELQYLGRWCPRILSGHDHPYRQGFHSPTQLFPQTVHSPGRPGMPATWSEDFQCGHPSRHQRQRDPQVATDVPGSNTRNSTSLRLRTICTQARNGRDGQGCTYVVADTDGH